MHKDKSSLSCITRVLNLPAYKRVSVVQASWDVLWATRRGGDGGGGGGRGGSKDDMEDEFVLANPMGVCSF